MNLCSIASGSSGNCIYAGNEETGVLIDAGISKKRIVEGLTSIDVNPSKLKGILVTHEHSDHICGLGVFTRTYKVPIFGTKETLSYIKENKATGNIEDSLLREINPDVPFYLNDIRINPFRISHDAKNPVSYTLTCDGKKIGIATDLGMYDDYIIENLKACDAILLEANHDINMLQVGSYPYQLKRRILSEKGHLSNDNSGQLLTQLFSSNLKYIFLGHLSKENNYPQLAYETVKCELRESGLFDHSDYHLSVALRDTPSEFVTV